MTYQLTCAVVVDGMIKPYDPSYGHVTDDGLTLCSTGSSMPF